MDLPSFKLNKHSDIWNEFLGIDLVDDFMFNENESICDLTMPTSDGENRYSFCERSITNYPDIKLFYNDKFFVLARKTIVCNKSVLLYYVELNPNGHTSIYEAVNEGTAIENFILKKYKLPAFSLYNAANLDIPLRKQTTHLNQLEEQSSSSNLMFQVVCINNAERLLFTPKPSEFAQQIKPIVLLLENTFSGKYKVVKSLDNGLEILNTKINKFCKN